MVEIIGGIDDFWTPRNNIDQVSEEAVQKAQEENRQAKQVAQQIQADKTLNQHFAAFLSMLLKKISHEELIKAIYDTFFKTINPQNNITYLRKDGNTKVIVWFFVPFFIKEAQEYKIFPFYEKLSPEESGYSIRRYVNYLEQLSATYHDNIPINQSAFVELVVLIIQYFILNEKGKPTEKYTPEELKATVLNYLYYSK